MLETLFVSLFLAALSALTFLAYKHPQGYLRLYKPLVWTTVVIVACLGAFDLGMMHARSALLPYLEINPDINPSSYHEAYDNARVFRFWYSYAALGLVVYFCSLCYLPNLIGADAQASAKEKASQD